jgi:hypothetical protein
MTTRLAPFVLAALLGACAAGRNAQPAVLTDLDGSLTPLHAWFDAHAGTPRVILLLSPV